MAIDLRDITDAVQSYLNKKVVIAITDVTPAEGDKVNPGESFDVNLEATNADATAGGVALTNLKFRVSVDDGSVAKLVVPEGTFFHSTDLDGKDVTKGTQRTSMIVQNTLFTKLGAGESLPLKVTGIANNAASGGKTTVRARVLADVDIEELFPQGEDTASVSKSLSVVG